MGFVGLDPIFPRFLILEAMVFGGLGCMGQKFANDRWVALGTKFLGWAGQSLTKMTRSNSGAHAWAGRTLTCIGQLLIRRMSCLCKHANR